MRSIGMLLAFLSFAAMADGVLVFGGTGKLGAYHVKLLDEMGEPVTVFHRATSNFDRLAGFDYRRIEGDLMDGDTVLRAMQVTKPSVVIDTSARRGAQMEADEPFYAIAMKNIVEAAKTSGVEHILIHSSIGVRDSAPIVKATFGYDTDSPNMRDKAQAEVVLEESGIPYTIIRNGLLDYEPVEPTGKGELIEDANTFGRIRRADLARLTIECQQAPRCFGKIYHAIDRSLDGPRPAQ